MRPETTSGTPAVPPSARLMDLTTAGWITQAVSVAATLGVADVLTTGPRTADEIAGAVDADPPSLHRILRVLADVEVFRAVNGGRFALTPVGELLRDEPGSLRGWAMMNGARFHLDAWLGLLDTARSGKPAFEQVHGQLGVDYLRTHTDDADVLNAAMTGTATQLTAPVVASYDFGPFHTVIDIGGGHGALLAAVLQAHPHLHGVLYELPEVVADAGRVLDAAGIADRGTCVAGDFFQTVPPGGDVYLLSNVIHDWDDDRATQILANVRRELPDDGRVLLAEAVLPDPPAPSSAHLVDLAMLVMGPGRQRTESELGALLARAGLHLLGTHQPGPGFALIEANAA